jgi:hypothetical protein
METADFFTYRDQAIADFDGLVEFHRMNFDLLKRGEPDRREHGVISPNFFNALGMTPVLGRSLVADDKTAYRRGSGFMSTALDVATSVSQRTQEFGVRMALGASRQTVLRMVIGEGLLLVGLGVVLGTIASFAVTRVLATYLFDAKPTDPLTFAAVVMAFIVAGIVACFGAAWRATTVDPMNALRAE